MNKELKLLICFLVMLGSIAPAFAVVPLIDVEAGTSLVTNMKAHKVGDIITVLITENTTANASSKLFSDCPTGSATAGHAGNAAGKTGV